MALNRDSKMKVGIMQPYFFPYIGYFQLINVVDRFILFDDVQYIRHGWINRNKILKPVEGQQYIQMPLAPHNRDTLIKNINVKDGNEWKEKILRQIEHYKKKAPFYPQVCRLLMQCFESTEPNIARLNGFFLARVLNYLGIDFKIEISSTMNFDYSNVNDAGEWALRISEQLGASEYINPPGGIAIFEKIKFEKSNIKLSFIHPLFKEYSQHRSTFEPGLSIIDVLMFNSPQLVLDLLNDYTIT